MVYAVYIKKNLASKFISQIFDSFSKLHQRNQIFGSNTSKKHGNIYTKNRQCDSIHFARIHEFVDFLRKFNGNLWPK